MEEEIGTVKRIMEYGAGVVVGFSILVGCLVWMHRDSRREAKKQKMRMRRYRKF